MVTILTNPRVICSIAVFYKSGRSRAAGLGPKTADDHGLITWTWMIGTRTTPGEWPIVVECGKEKVTRLQTSFVVT